MRIFNTWNDLDYFVKTETMRKGPEIRYIYSLRIEFSPIERKINLLFEPTKNSIITVKNIVELFLLDPHIEKEDFISIQLNQNLFKNEDIFINENSNDTSTIIPRIINPSIVKCIENCDNPIIIEYSNDNSIDYELNCLIYPVWKNKPEDIGYWYEIKKW